jgi:putative hemolysin
MNGLASFEEVAKLLEIPVEEDSFETLNGLLVSLLDKIPCDGDTAKINAYGYDFLIRRVEDKIIREVLVKKVQPLASADK